MGQFLLWHGAALSSPTRRGERPRVPPGRHRLFKDAMIRGSPPRMKMVWVRPRLTTAGAHSREVVAGWQRTPRSAFTPSYEPSKPPKSPPFNKEGRTPSPEIFRGAEREPSEPAPQLREARSGRHPAGIRRLAGNRLHGRHTSRHRPYAYPGRKPSPPQR